MPPLTVEEAQSQLSALIDRMQPGEELVIMRNAQPVAKLVIEPRPAPQPVFGRGRDKLVRYVEDEEHLKDFAEYQP